MDKALPQKGTQMCTEFLQECMVGMSITGEPTDQKIPELHLALIQLFALVISSWHQGVRLHHRNKNIANASTSNRAAKQSTGKYEMKCVGDRKTGERGSD